MKHEPNEPVAADFELLRQLRGLPRERTPDRDLWQGIEARIGRNAAAPPRRRGIFTALALAASLAAVALFVTRLAPAPGTETAPVAAAGATAARAAPPPPGTLRGDAEALTLEYRLALQPFAAAALPRPLRAAAQELDASADELRQALRAQPDAPYLLERLRHTYDQRLKLAQRVALG
jgi:hypothetical protein